jgi:uncharacterized protein (TIGR03067 family)
MKSAVDALQGTWNIVSIEVEGRKYPPAGAQIVICGERFVSLNMGAEFEGTIRLDESATPHTVDLLYDKGPHAGNASLGIYELNGEEWKLCLGLAGMKRPTEFASKPGAGHALEILRRQAGSTAETSDDATPTELEGKWQMTSCIQDGQPMKKNMASMVSRVFAGNRTTLYIGGKQSSASQFQLRGSQIDLTSIGQAGMFELTGSTLKTALAEPGGARPEDYSAQPGDRRTVSEWKRKS